MARKKKVPDQEKQDGLTVVATAKVTNIQGKKTELKKLKEENARLKKQLAAIMNENMILRAQAKQPEKGPLIPPFILKDTVERLDDPDWYYRALDDQNRPMVLEKATGKWIRYSRALYIRYNGPIPNDWIVSPIDGNNRNLDPLNWIAMPKNEFINTTGYTFESSFDGRPATAHRVNLKTGEILKEDDDG